MNVMLEEADVVVGNYNHLFDPRTRPLLSSILDDQTFVIVDEAHRLEERVRDLIILRQGWQADPRASAKRLQPPDPARPADPGPQTAGRGSPLRSGEVPSTPSRTLANSTTT